MGVLGQEGDIYIYMNTKTYTQFEHSGTRLCNNKFYLTHSIYIDIQ